MPQANNGGLAVQLYGVTTTEVKGLKPGRPMSPAQARVGLLVANDSQARFDNFTLMVPAGASDRAASEGEAVPGAAGEHPPLPPPALPP